MFGVLSIIKIRWGSMIRIFMKKIRNRNIKSGYKILSEYSASLRTSRFACMKIPLRYIFITDSAHEFRLQYKLNVQLISKIISQLNDIIEDEVHLI